MSGRRDAIKTEFKKLTHSLSFPAKRIPQRNTIDFAFRETGQLFLIKRPPQAGVKVRQALGYLPLGPSFPVILKEQAWAIRDLSTEDRKAGLPNPASFTMFSGPCESQAEGREVSELRRNLLN